MPILAGQSETYLRESLRAYAEGHRASGIMQMAVRGLSPAELAALARHYAALPDAEPPEPRPAIDRAAELASQGRAADGVPACLDCHAGGRDPHFPTLAGQRADYIAAQLELFRAGVRGGTAYRPSDDPGRSAASTTRTSPRWRRYFASLAPVSAAEAETR